MSNSYNRTLSVSKIYGKGREEVVGSSLNVSFYYVVSKKQNFSFFDQNIAEKSVISRPRNDIIGCQKKIGEKS